jgi:hypothetical protein
LNPGLDLRFGSVKLLNLGLDLEGLVQQVQSRQFSGSNLELQTKHIKFGENPPKKEL